MHYNRHNNNVIENVVKCQTYLNTKSNINQSKNKLESDEVTATLFLETNKKQKRDTVGQKKSSLIENYSRNTTNSSLSSTDSGVNVNDNGFMPPPPTSNNTSSNLYLFETKATPPSQCSRQFYKNIKNESPDNNINNNEGYKCNSIKKSNKNNIINDNDVDYDVENNNIHSDTFDNKFKVPDSCKEATRNLQKTQNVINSKNVIEINQPLNYETLTLTENSTIPENDDNPSLQHNEFINLQQRPASPTSSLSMSSLTCSYDSNFPTNMQVCSGSPVVSIRSISSAIITSDSDSDSDINNREVENYVIKKLGTQVTYLPNDPKIPNINNGKTVLNQKVIPNSNEVPIQPLADLCAIGDRIGAAQALGPLPSNSGVNQRPQIGSIALSNSSDVTFGDKHFYEGPVTIQQFIIDSREKRNEKDGNENPMFVNDDIETAPHNAKDINPSEVKSSKLYEYILKRKTLIIPGILTFTALLIITTIWQTKALNDSKNTNKNNAGDHSGCNGTLCLIERDGWRAHPQKNALDKQKLPMHRVIISHTASEPCESIQICAERVRVIQEFHMHSFHWDDIGYNFLISSDGLVYVGRGWDYVGAHTKGYNYDSVGITFIGTYISTEPTEVQLNACQALLEMGQSLKKLSSDYRLYGARQLGATESPGDMLYKRIKKWDHWSQYI